MLIEPSIQEQLLAVQAKDTESAQLAFKKANLPELAQLAELQEQFAKARDQLVAAEVILSDLQRDQARSDADVDVVRQRIRKDQSMLDSGAINDPKQLSSLQHELGSLARRQVELEDVELEIMERVEGALAAVSVLTERKENLSLEIASVSSQLEQQVAALESDLAEVAAERERLASSIPDDFKNLYEKIRKSHSGVGAAKLHRGQCLGCRLSLPPQELQTIKNAEPEEVLQCEECRRILIRTADSGI